MNRVEAFGLAVREARLSAGLSQEALAEKAGLHRNWISLIERGINPPALDSIFLVADALGTSAAVLLGAAERRANEDRA